MAQCDDVALLISDFKASVDAEASATNDALAHRLAGAVDCFRLCEDDVGITNEIGAIPNMEEKQRHPLCHRPPKARSCHIGVARLASRYRADKLLGVVDNWYKYVQRATRSWTYYCTCAAFYLCALCRDRAGCR